MKLTKQSNIKILKNINNDRKQSVSKIKFKESLDPEVQENQEILRKHL